MNLMEELMSLMERAIEKEKNNAIPQIVDEIRDRYQDEETEHVVSALINLAVEMLLEEGETPFEIIEHVMKCIRFQEGSQQEEGDK